VATEPEVATAIVRRLAHRFSADVRVDLVDRDRDLFSETGFALDGHELDSLDLVEAIGTLEQELGVAVLDEDLEQVDTINRLAQSVTQRADVSVLQRFCKRWS
jgi:acyl carrier protein